MGVDVQTATFPGVLVLLEPDVERCVGSGEKIRVPIAVKVRNIYVLDSVGTANVMAQQFIAQRISVAPRVLEPEVHGHVLILPHAGGRATYDVEVAVAVDVRQIQVIGPVVECKEDMLLPV